MQVRVRPKEFRLDIDLGDNHKGAWCFRAATHGERKDVESRSVELAEALGEVQFNEDGDGVVTAAQSKALIEINAFARETIARFTTRLVGFEEDWPEDEEGQVDLCSRLDRDSVDGLYKYVREHCLGLSVETAGN